MVDKSLMHNDNTTKAETAQALHRPMRITRFPNEQAFSKKVMCKSTRELAEWVERQSAPSKAELAWLKLARFGSNKSKRGCYRTNDNMMEIDGIEGDYDGEVVSLDEANCLVKKAGFAAMLYPTASHTPATPRWRVFCPLSEAMATEARDDLVARLNGALGGILARESFTKSLSYYAGTVNGAEPIKTILVEGEYIDKVEHLSPIYKDGGKTKPKPKKNTVEKSGLPFDEVVDALMAIPNDGSNPDDDARDWWLHIGMALHYETDGDEEGLDAFHQWSAQHGSYDAIKTDAAWESFGGDGYTVGTILREAYKRGWRNIAMEDRLLDDCWTAEELDCIARISAKERETDRKEEHFRTLDADAFALLWGPISKVAVRVRLGEGKPIMRGDKPVINLHNTTLYLGRDLDSILPGLAHNQMTGWDEWRDGQLTDAVVSIARIALEKRGLETVGKELVADAAKTVALKFAYHPIRDELNGLRWDGVPRLDSWLVRHAGADETPYTRAVSRKSLIAMVARVMQPGCKHDHTLVLSGEQGQNKSKMCKALAGEQYFSESLPSIRSDKTDAIRHLQGKWLVELAELAPSRTSDAEDLKAFLSGAVDRVRMPYAKFDEAFPRQCVFVGTTNDDQFLRDATGGRRFWPVAVRQVIDVDSLADERDQLFAEAVAAFKVGEPWWLDREFESEHAAPVQAAAYISDSWVDDVARWLDKPRDHLDDKSEAKMEITISEVLSDALNVPTERQTQPVQKRVASVLRQIGWIKVKTKTSNKWRRSE
jgi:Virulence-associated protein E-like domain/Primase C terminal 2 (PriCT-2)